MAGSYHIGHYGIDLEYLLKTENSFIYGLE